MVAKKRKFLEKRALRIEQHEDHPLYLLSLTGEELLSIADVSRISRSSAGKLIGYQRPEVKRHVDDIVSYLNSRNVIFPNSIIMSFSSRVKFRRSRGPQIDDKSVAAGVLEIPISRKDGPKPAWIVDGQQRALAISKSKRRDLRIPINAFVADHVDIQRDQFIRINNSRPLPRGLITELLPEMSSPLPDHLAPSKLPSAICDLLNLKSDSPFCGLIRRASSTDTEKKKALIADTSVVKMVQESLTTPSGCLFPYRNMATGDIDSKGIWAVLTIFWRAVSKTFPDAWGKPPARSRLMHGVGIRAMGRLMDRIMVVVSPRERAAPRRVAAELQRIAPLCRWTSGKWEEMDDLPWNELQNVPRHIRMLSNFLLRKHVESKGARA